MSVQAWPVRTDGIGGRGVVFGGVVVFGGGGGAGGGGGGYLSDNNLTGRTLFHFPPCLVYESTTCIKNVLICAGRVDPHRSRRAYQPD